MPPKKSGDASRASPTREGTIFQHCQELWDRDLTSEHDQRFSLAEDNQVILKILREQVIAERVEVDQAVQDILTSQQADKDKANNRAAKVEMRMAQAEDKAVAEVDMIHNGLSRFGQRWRCTQRCMRRSKLRVRR